MLKPEEMKVGRRNFMKAAAVLPAVGAYVATAKIAEPVKVAWIGTGGQGQVLLDNAPYDGYIQVVAVADIRPDYREMGAAIVRQKCCPDVRSYANYKDMLSDGGFEAVVIATPLLTHGPITVDCLNAGYHVLCEKTMAYTTADCELMISTAQRTGKVLAVGHQRHANPLYLNTKNMVDQGILGDVHHIRSLWHRNHSWRRSPAGEWRNEILKAKWGEYPIEGVAKMLGITGEDAGNPNIVMREEGKADAPFYTEQKQYELYFQYLAEKEPEFEENYKAAGFESADMLGNWRLYKKMSHGLMSELGSHQIDVCNWLWGAEPDFVSCAGGIWKFKDGREVADHIFAIFQYPGDKVMTFSSITTNRFDHYYDQVMGTKGTVYLTGESEAFMYSEDGGKLGEIKMESGGAGAATGAASGSRARDMAGGATADGDGASLSNPFEPYNIELQMFAQAIRKGDPSLVGCDGTAGYKASIAVLRSVEAQEENVVKSCRLSEVQNA